MAASMTPAITRAMQHDTPSDPGEAVRILDSVRGVV